MKMGKTELEFKSAIIYRIWRSVQVKLDRVGDMPRSYSSLKEIWKEPFRAVARMRIPVVMDVWDRRMTKRKEEHASAYREVGITSQCGTGRSRGS